MNFRALGAAIVSATTLCAAEVPLARIGVMSDIHLTGPESAAAFRRVLEYCRDAGVDAVVIAGDIADNGHFPELALCAGVWDEVFPGDALPDGRRVFEYRLRVLDGDGAEQATRIVVAPDYAAPAGEPAVPGVCLFALDELPTGQPLRIEVSPLNCFGAAGKPIVGEFRADIAANDPTPVDDASPVIRQHE